MKKILLTLLAMSLATTVALAVEDTVSYGETTYVYGGEAVETTDDNESGYLDGLVLRGVEEATYYSAGEGFVYFTPATEETPAVIILDNASMVADYCIQAVTDVDLILVGENLLHATGADLFCMNVLEAYDENMEQKDYEDCDFGTLRIDGDGSLQVISAGYVAFNVGRFAIHGGDVSITLEDGGSAAILADSNYETSDVPGFLMDGGTLDIDMGENGGWGIEAKSADVCITGGALTISGGVSDSIGVMASAFTKDVSVSVTGGTTVIESNGTASFAAVKFNADVFVNTVVNFADAPEGVFALSGLFQFVDVLDVYGDTGTVVISAFDALMVENSPLLTVSDLRDYLYCINEYPTHDLDETMLTDFAASMVGEPEITDVIRNGITFPYTTGSNPTTAFTLTRAQVIALLWDAMGCPEATMDNPFSDVSEDDGYYQAILWAVEQGITTGITATTFEPDVLCTKGQLLSFLYRNAGEPEVDVENCFADVSESSYLYDAVLWGIANTMMDVEAATFDAATTVLSDGAIAYLICMG